MEYEIGSDESVSLAVQKAADMHRKADPRDTETLYEVVDTDALDELFAPVKEDTPRSSGRVSFVYRGCRVTISNGEYLTITRAAADEDHELPHTPTSKDELEEALDMLVQEAYHNGVKVDNGGYELLHRESTIPDWDLTIIRME